MTMLTREEIDVAGVPAKPAPQRRAGVVVGMTNHERPDCAHINMEIIKLNYPEPWPVVLACSGVDYQPHLEDVLVPCQPRDFIDGALNLLRQSFRAAVEEYNPKYLVHLEADTWVFDQRVMLRYIDRLERNPQALIAASSWSTDQRPGWRRSKHPFARLKLLLARGLNALGVDFGVKRKDTLSTQFFIVRNEPRFLDLLDRFVPSKQTTLERDFYHAFVNAFGKRAIVGMPEREPVHPGNKDSCEALTLYAQHWPKRSPRPLGKGAKRLPNAGGTGPYDTLGKKEVLARHGFRHLGPAMRRLLEAEDTRYYNPRAKRY